MPSLDERALPVPRQAPTASVIGSNKVAICFQTFVASASPSFVMLDYRKPAGYHLGVPDANREVCAWQARAR